MACFRIALLLSMAIATIGVLPALSHAADEPAKHKLVLGLDDCIRIALKTAPELGEAQADIEAMTSKLDEAGAHRFPQIEFKALLGPAQKARAQDLFATDKQIRLSELTWFSSTDATLIQPLYTFGKISENMKAATHGIEVDRSRKTQRANEIAMQVKEYYFGLQLARELKELILEIKDDLGKARRTAQKMLDQDSPGVDEIDIYKLDAFSGEVEKYLQEALKGEKLATAALKTRLGLSGDSQIEISDKRLAIDDRPVPTYEAFVDKARNRRPEFRQIAEGLKARSALVAAAKADYYPDIFLGGLFSWAYANDRDHIHNPYITDQFQHINGGVALGARWKLDFGITRAKVAGEQAQYNRLISTKQYADANIPLEIRQHYLELQEAEKSAVATKTAYTNAKKWVVAALANFDFGVGPAKDIFDGLQAYAQMRSDYLKSIYNFNIARAKLAYATGEPPTAATGSPAHADSGNHVKD